MLPKKRAITLMTASLLTGSVLGTGMISFNGTAHAASAKVSDQSTAAEKDAAEKLTTIYYSAYEGHFPNNAFDFYIGKSTKADVHEKWGPPSTPISKTSDFEIYHAEMGNPGYAFSYDKNNIIKEIRNLGTNVERDHSIGGITVKMLGDEIGSADHIRHLRETGETSYIYETGDFELEFIIGKNGKADHVNLLRNQ
ncbi:YjgB family protein [Fictibacillus fluitans]|uniref:YjgB family protein n=1 Tax=Fictibacillus fluitans TaxID=3058422 RepID=A0ABT8HZC1_9BACL|nr:YjgB family protein [Fictibacillus sp. NE201]MDN4526122.1 YjgB family protein [Fictibacillus sp. NE201]